MRILCLILLTFLTSGCAHTQQDDADPMQWGRYDCQRSGGNWKLTSEFEQARDICVNRAQANAVAGTTAIPTGYGLGGAIASGIERGMAQNQIVEATVRSCMAERGFVYKRRSEHEACVPPSPPAAPAPEKPKRR